MTKEFGTITTIEDRNKALIAQLFKKQTKNTKEFNVEELAQSLCEQAIRYHTEVVGFGDHPETNTNKETKDFGVSEGEMALESKVLRFMVADNSTIEYPNEAGEQELYTFPRESLEDLGKKLEGVPVVVGNGHDADLPLAYFTKDFEVKKHDDGKVELFVEAKLREDSDAPVDFEALVQNPQWNVNGGANQLSGSLRFDSFDVPYFFDNGSKINFMTRTVPRHYALVDVPHIAASGLVGKNFSKEGVINMTEEVKTEVTAQAEVETEDVQAEVVMEEVHEEVKAEEEVVAEVVEETPEVTEPETVEAEIMEDTSEVDALKARIAEVETELLKARENELVSKILVKAIGPEYTEKEATEFVEAKLKNFGEGELKGFLAGMGAPTGPATKDFGRGRLDPTDSGTKTPKLELSYLKNKKVN